MEQKELKTNIFSNEIIFSESVEQPIDVDFSLPDYCPDISKIFKCRAVPRISSKGINGRTLTVEGVVCITLIYADRTGELCSFEYQYPFAKNLEMNNECANPNICCKIRCEYINCRAVTGRKVDVHGAVGIFVKVFKKKSCDIISDYDDCTVELKRGVTPATVPMGYAEKYIMIEEDLHLGQGQPAIRSILRCDSNSCIKETKIINGKAVVKGEMSVALLYCPDGGGAPQSLKSNIPFSQIIDVEGMTEACRCDTKSEIAFFEAKPRVNTSGELKCFTVTAKLLLSCEAYCSNDLAVIFDAYSRKYEAEIKKNKVLIDTITSNIGENYSCKKSIELEDDITSVIDLWCNVQSAVTKFENCNMVVYGTLVIGMIVVNKEENSLYVEKPIEFEYKHPVDCNIGTPHSEPQIEIISCSYTITASNRMETNIQLSINAAIYEKKEINLISDITVDSTKQIQRKNKNAMTVYFPNEGETVWDIARNYNASVEEIMRINALDSQNLCSGKMLLVPML